MKHNIIAATILAVGLIVAAFVYSGRYYFIRVDSDTIVRADRWTGKVERVPASTKAETEWWLEFGDNSN